MHKYDDGKTDMSMKRLTKWIDYNKKSIPQISCDVCGKKPITECWDTESCLDTGVERLAEIEDILGDDYDLDRLREIVEADRDGRCVVLPCKVGNTVYRIGASLCKWREIDRCDEYCDGWQYRDCWDGTRAVLEEKFNLCDIESVGKTVFLTREAAEAVLKGEQNEV